MPATAKLKTSWNIFKGKATLCSCRTIAIFANCQDCYFAIAYYCSSQYQYFKIAESFHKHLCLRNNSTIYYSMPNNHFWLGGFFHDSRGYLFAI